MKGNHIYWLWQLMRPHRGSICLGLLLAVLASSAAALDPLLIRYLVDKTLPQHAIGASLLIVLSIGGCFAARGVFASGSTITTFAASQQLLREMRLAILTHMTELSYEWHEQTSLGEKLSCIQVDVEDVAQLAAETVGACVRTLIFLLIYLMAILLLNWKMALSVFPIFPLFLFLRSRFRSRLHKLNEDARKEVGVVFGKVAEHLNAVPQLQLLNADQGSLRKTELLWMNLLLRQRSQKVAEVAFNVSVTAVLALAVLLALGSGVYEFSIMQLSLGGLIAFYAYVTRLFEPISNAVDLYSRTERSLSSCNRIWEVLQIKGRVSDLGHITPVPSLGSARVCCKEVSFCYSPEKPVLRHISIDFMAEERISIVGRSGSGKSTLFRLIARVLDPDTGNMSLAGRDYKEYKLSTIRSTIAYVPQVPVLFSGSIRDNLIIANRSALDKDIEVAIEAAQLRPVLARLSKGIDSALGPEACNLSGGERQRIAIARALLQKPAIILLDESTSALDLATERQIYDSIASDYPELGMIVISHRLRSLRWVDRIAVIDAGQIICQGSHDSVYRACPLYAQLYDTDC